QNVPFPADHGKAAVRRTFTAFGRFVTSFDIQMRNIAARDGVVLTERVDVLTGPLLYLDLWVCGTFELRDGKIAVWRAYFDLACQAAALGPLRVGLELPADEQARIDEFLASAAAAADGRALFEGPFWTRDFQDGRSSTAMAALLASLGKLVRDGADVSVIAF